MERSISKLNDKISILYHSYCLDGFMCATIHHVLTSLLELKGLNQKETIMRMFGNVQKREVDAMLKNGEYIGELEPYHDDRTHSKYYSYAHHEFLKMCSSFKMHEGKGNTLLIIDVSTKELVQKACEVYDTVLVIDHHKTLAEEIIPDEEFLGRNQNLYIVYNTKICASLIYLNQIIEHIPEFAESLSDSFGKKLEKFCKLINESDTMSYCKRSSEAHEFSTAVYSMSYIENFNKGASPRLIEKFLSNDVDTYCLIGKPRFEDIQKKINQKKKSSSKVQFSFVDRSRKRRSIKCRIVNSDDKVIKSGLGEYLALLSKKEGNDPIGIVIQKIRYGGYSCSIRGVEVEGEQQVDVEEIARHFGGAGHRFASGFAVKSMKVFNFL